MCSEIEAEVQAGRLHSFCQHRDILEPYDGHPDMTAGREDTDI